ncbi:hypothetical protein ACLOJK_038961 [Asimina triloba]
MALLVNDSRKDGECSRMNAYSEVRWGLGIKGYMEQKQRLEEERGEKKEDAIRLVMRALNESRSKPPELEFAVVVVIRGSDRGRANYAQG